MSRPDRAIAALGSVPSVVLVSALALGLIVPACGDDGGGDDAGAFCSGVAALQASSPFDDLDVASPREMRDAFDALAAAAGSIADAAPDDAAVQARRYRATIDALTDELAAAGYDPTRVDTRAYGAATEAYTEAAISLENVAGAMCP